MHSSSTWTSCITLHSRIQEVYASKSYFFAPYHFLSRMLRWIYPISWCRNWGEVSVLEVGAEWKIAHTFCRSRLLFQVCGIWMLLFMCKMLFLLWNVKEVALRNVLCGFSCCNEGDFWMKNVRLVLQVFWFMSERIYEKGVPQSRQMEYGWFQSTLFE